MVMDIIPFPQDTTGLILATVADIWKLFKATAEFFLKRRANGVAFWASTASPRTRYFPTESSAGTFTT
jgi:hypothetical protein